MCAEECREACWCQAIRQERKDTKNACKCIVHLCNELDDFDKNVERHVSRDDAAGAFWEQCGNDGCQTAAERKERGNIQMERLREREKERQKERERGESLSETYLKHMSN